MTTVIPFTTDETPEEISFVGGCETVIGVQQKFLEDAVRNGIVRLVAEPGSRQRD